MMKEREYRFLEKFFGLSPDARAPDTPPKPLLPAEEAEIAAQSPETLRQRAERYERLAKAAEGEGDTWDAAECRAMAHHCRRAARRKEVK